MAFVLRKREEPWKGGALVINLGALAFSLGASFAMLALAGMSPVQGMHVFWAGTFGNVFAMEDALIKSVPLFLCSLGVAVAFRMQVWNIGAEGQFALGAIGATWAALTFKALPAWLLLPLMFLSAFVCGGLWALGPALLKLKLRVNEIITTLMLNYIAILLLEYMVFGAWKDPSSFGFPMTPQFVPAAVVGLIGGTRLHWGFAVCLAAGLLLWAFMRFTVLGYELKAGGESARVARYAGLPYNFLVMLVMTLSGGLSALAGCVQASAVLGRLQPSIMAGYGYTAIVVAWLARLQPLPIAVVSFLLALLRVGVENLQLEMKIPAAYGMIMEGFILLSVLAGQVFLSYRLKSKGN